MSAPTEHEDDVALQYEAGLVCLTSKCAVALLKEHATCNGCNSQLVRCNRSPFMSLRVSLVPPIPASAHSCCRVDLQHRVSR